MSRVTMLLSNAFRPDPRVAREAEGLARAGHEVTVICWDRRGEFSPREQGAGFEVRRIVVRSDYAVGTRQALYLPRFWRRALREMANLAPEIVHCHDLDTAPAGYWYARRHHLPWVFDAHECYPEQMAPQVNRAVYRLLLLLEAQLVRRADYTLTVGEVLAQRFRALGGRVLVIGNYPALQPLDSPFPISRADLGLGPDELIVAYIGGLTPGRAILPLIEATAELPEATVLVLGDGPQRAAVEGLLPRYPRARYLGQVPQSDVPAYTALADVLYYGLYESFGNNRYSCPNALFNAMAAGRPIVTTDVGEIAHIVRTERCGLVVERPTPRLLAQAIAQLRDPAVRRSLGANARQAAEARYNWAAAERRLVQAYAGLGGGGRRPIP